MQANQHPLTDQRGIALMTVLLILAIATVALVSMSSSRQLDIRRTENLIRTAQTWEYLYSLESWAGNVLQQDHNENKLDSLDDKWTQPLAKTRVPGGTMQAEITDLQGRFNLNNLLVENQPSELDIKRFQRLLVFLKIKPEIVGPILDWIDRDVEIRYPEGAEDETYMRRKIPYRSANRFFSDVSELLLVHGITREDYDKLKPYVYVTENYAPLNINTADPLLIRSLVNELSNYQTELLVRARTRQPFEKIEDFLKQDAFAGLGLTKEGLSVTSNHFLLSGTIQVGKILLMFDSQLKRKESGQTALVKRQRRSPQ